MSDTELNTLQLCRCVERWKAGDRAAADELLSASGNRLELLARKMLKSFPNVREWAETGDVLQGSLIRLLHTLHNLTPASTRDFFGLAALHIRRELLDLARRYRAGRATFVNADQEAAETSNEKGLGTDKGLALWCRFHEAVEVLPAEEREVVGLSFYHGWTQVQIAELFGVDERTIRRRWQSACARLLRLAGGELPGE